MRSHLATILIALLCGFVTYGQDNLDEELLDLYTEKGANLVKSFQLDSGTFYLNKAIAGHKKNENWEKYFESQYYLCVSYFLKTRNVQAAQDSLQSNLNLATVKMGEAGSGAGEMYFGLGWLTDNGKRDYPLASEYYFKALSIWEGSYGQAHEKTAKAYANYTLSLINAQQLGRAEEYLLKALDVYQEAFPASHAEWGRLYNTAFYYYNGLRQLEKASTYANAMYQLSATNESATRQWRSRACRNLTMTYYNLQEYDLAAKYALEELEFGKGILNEAQIAGIYNNLGRIYWFSDAEKALNYTIKAKEMKISALGPEHPSTISSSINHASALADFGDPSEAIKLYQKLIRQPNILGNSTENELRTWNLLTKTFNYNGQWNESIETFQTMEEKYVEASNGNLRPDLLFIFYANAATFTISSFIELYKETGNLDFLEQGNDCFLRVDSLMSQNWKNLEYSSDQQSFLNLNAEFYVVAADLFYHLFRGTGEISYADRFLYTSEKSKASISFPAFVLALKKDQLKVPSEVLDFKKNLDIEIAQLENEGNGSSLLIKKSTRDSLIDVIKVKYPTYYSERIADISITANQIQEQLTKDETAIIYMTNVATSIRPESVVTTLMLTKDGLKMWRNTTNYIQEKIESFLQRVKERRDVDTESKELYAILGLDSIEVNSTGRSMVIVPNNELFSLPFELLRNESGTPLIENYNITYNSSASIMINKRESDPVRTAALFAPELGQQNQLVAAVTREKKSLEPLYNSIKEVSQISDIIGGENINALSKASMLERMGQSDIIHLATHAEVSHSSPGSSELYLSNDRDSSIYAYELYNQNFKAQLVTLSACNTGVGKLQKGEGIQSLGKAFTFAGCQNIVMSLWPVNDESTAELMTQFYKNLKDGMRKDEALRQAKLTYVQNADPVRAHPYYWAGFVFSGDPEPLEFESKWFGNWILLAIVIFVMIGLLRRKKNQSSSSS